MTFCKKVRVRLSRHLLLALCLLFTLTVPWILTSSFHETETFQEADLQPENSGSEAKEETGTKTEAEPRILHRAAYYAKHLKEKDIYSFSQGPYAWENGYEWSGAWCQEVLAGQLFSVFGCGLCAMANIYSSLTGCECSPTDMFFYAQEVSGYTPVSGFGAIDWPYIQQTLKTTGIRSSLKPPAESYEAFRTDISRTIAAVVLINSVRDSSYWQTNGHYVTIWLYDSEDDTVFLTDSGNPAHNRQRIPLAYVYNALDPYTACQYLLITAVDEKGNTWKHDGIDADWIAPSDKR